LFLRWIVSLNAQDCIRQLDVLLFVRRPNRRQRGNNEYGLKASMGNGALIFINEVTARYCRANTRFRCDKRHTVQFKSVLSGSCAESDM
jgi:hypothetical protein